MPVTVEIDGVGKVELDDGFRDMSPADQQRTVMEIRSSVDRSQPPPQSPRREALMRPQIATTPGAKPFANAKMLTEKMFPGVRVTDWKRDPNSPLGLQNPDSWHNRSGAAVDIAPIPGMTFEQVVQAYEDAGYPLIEAKDEVKNPAPHATGPHWHFVIGENPNGGAFDANTDDEAIQDPNAPPGSQPELPFKAPPAEPETQGTDYSLGAIGHQLAVGTGDIVEGAGDVLGLLGNPLNATINSVAGTNLSTDLGASLRDGLGFPEGEGLGSEIRSGMASGLLSAGGAAAGGKVAGNAIQKGLYELGSTPIRDAVAGGASAASSGLAEEAGAPEWVQIGAGFAGGLAGYGAAGLPKHLSADAKATRFANKQAAKNPYAAFDAEIVADIAKTKTDAAVSGTDPKGRAAVTAKTINSVETRYFAEYKNAINALDIPIADKLRLKEALTGKYSFPQSELQSLRGTVAGDAVADAVTKVQRLRALTPELKRSAGLITRASDVVDFVPGIPGVVGRGMRAMARATGDGEAARVNAAEKLLKRQRGYEKLGMKVGPSGQRESQAAFRDLLVQKEEAAAAEAAQSAAEKDTRAFDREARPIIREKVKATTPQESIAVTEARKAMTRRAGRMATASERKLDSFDDKLNAPPPATKEPTAAERKALRDLIPNLPTRDDIEFVPGQSQAGLDPRDLRFPQPTEKQMATKAQSRAAAIAKLEGKATDWETLLADPSTAPKPKAAKANPEAAAIDRAIEQGVQGEGRALQHYADALGITPDEAKTVLAAVAKNNPELADEARRIGAGFNSTNKRMGPTLRPLMQARLEELGIVPKAADAAPAPTPIDEAAQARLAAKDSVIVAEGPGPAGKPIKVGDDMPLFDDGEGLTTGTSSVDEGYKVAGSTNPGETPEAAMDRLRKELGIGGEVLGSTSYAPDGTAVIGFQMAPPDMRRINRPGAWQAGANRYMAQADDAIYAIGQDAAISREAMDVIGNAPRQLKENFKTISEATDYIETSIIPDLEAEGFSAGEINRVKKHLYEVAQAKPHATPEALEAATRTRPAGRKPKPE